MEVKLEGNELFKQREFAQAAEKFVEAAGEDTEIASVCWGNASACYYELENYKECVEACDKALELNEEYTKVRRRRARANDKLDTWQSLEKCVEDLDKLGDEQEKQRIAPRLKAKQQHETEQMMGKLKDLGNSFLGNFGMSLDQFKMNQKEDGSYSMSM